MSDVPEPTTRENVGNLSFANHRHVRSSVVITLVWLGSGKDHVWAENTWKSPQNVKYIQRFVAYECYDSSAPSRNMNIS